MDCTGDMHHMMDSEMMAAQRTGRAQLTLFFHVHYLRCEFLEENIKMSDHTKMVVYDDALVIFTRCGSESEFSTDHVS